MSPDFSQGKQEEATEERYHAALAERLDETEKQQIREDARALEERQKTPGDIECLPRLSSTDIPLEIRPIRAVRDDMGRLTSYQ